MENNDIVEINFSQSRNNIKKQKCLAQGCFAMGREDGL